MNLHSEINSNHRFVQMEVGAIQQLIQFNKVQIRELDTERKYLEHIIQLYWNSCDPIHPSGILSSTAFSCLNAAKGDLAIIKKKLKLLSETQCALKYSIR